MGRWGRLDYHENMDLDYKNRLRVESCIGEIIDLQRTFSADYQDEEFISLFEELSQTIEGLGMSLVSEGDIQLVESATNSLLEKFKAVFKGEKLVPVYAQRKN